VGIGIVHPDQVKRNAGAQPGDMLILGKPLGIGILSAALKKNIVSADGYTEMVRWTTKLNTVGAQLAQISGVHAVTDVTGFGFAGHLLEICRGSQLMAEVEFARLPLIEEAVTHLKAGISTGASSRNWQSYGDAVSIITADPAIAVPPAPTFEEWQQKMLTDPQTSGGLLVACSRDSVEAVLAAFHADGFDRAAIIGEMHAGPARLDVI
jgi:selenide,water dikinase